MASIAASESPAGPYATGINDLPIGWLLRVFSLVGAKDLARLACVQRSWASLIADDRVLWAPRLKADYGPATPMGPKLDPSQPPATHREAYKAWYIEFGYRYSDLLPRAVRALSTIKASLQHQLPQMVATLAPGASEAQLDEAEASLGAPMPPALRVLYRLVNGQELEFDRQREAMPTVPPIMHPSIFYGLFGGYMTYDDLICMRMLPLDRMVRYSGSYSGRVLAPRRLAVVAASLRIIDRAIVVDLSDGSVHVAAARSGANAPAAPADATPGARDGVLRWFEQYAEQLRSGNLRVAPLAEEDFGPDSKGVCLFPQLPPLCGLAVTRGFEVRSSVVYSPQLCRSRKDAMFSYSIRYRLPAHGEQALKPGEWPLDSGQLQDRHWLITHPDGTVDEVRGDGVVGHHPLLIAGGPEFVYQSCTNSVYGPHGPDSLMQGSFGFVEGSAVAPGARMEIAAPLMRLQLPDYVF